MTCVMCILWKKTLPWHPWLPWPCFHPNGMKGKKSVATKVDNDVDTKVVKLEALEEFNFLLQILHPSNWWCCIYVDMKTSLECLHKWPPKILNMPIHQLTCYMFILKFVYEDLAWVVTSTLTLFMTCAGGPKTFGFDVPKLWMRWYGCRGNF